MTRVAAPLARLHVVTDDEVLSRVDWLDRAREVLDAGGGEVALHLRGPRTPGRKLFRHTEALLRAAKASQAHLVVNDRVDVALAAGVGAVHLGRRSLRVGDARKALGAKAAVGVSCHSAPDVVAAHESGADWVFVGNVFLTPTHSGRPGLELDGLRAIASAASVPVVGIGGIVPTRAGEVRRAGAAGVAVIRGVWDAASPADRVAEYLSALSG